MKLSKRLLLCSILTLNGCDTVKNTLGLTRSEPDEFNVIDRHHLTVPPRYNLRPPAVGQENPAVINPQDQARQSLGGQTDTQSKYNRTQSSGDKALMDKLSNYSSENDIRSIITNEHEKSKKTVNNRIADLSKSQTDNKEMIDPHAEYEERMGHPHPSKYLEEVK